MKFFGDVLDDEKLHAVAAVAGKSVNAVTVADRCQGVHHQHDGLFFDVDNTPRLPLARCLTQIRRRRSAGYRGSNGLARRTAHIEQKRHRHVPFDFMRPPKNFLRGTDAEAQIDHRFDGRVEVVIGAVGQTFFLVIDFRRHLFEFAPDLPQQTRMALKRPPVKVQVADGHDLLVDSAPVTAVAVLENVPLVVHESVGLRRRKRAGVVVVLLRWPSLNVLHARVAPLQLAHEILHHLRRLGILLLAFFVRIPRFRSPLAAEQICQLLGRQGFALLARIGLGLRQELRQLRPEFAAIIHPLRRQVLPLSPDQHRKSKLVTRQIIVHPTIGTTKPIGTFGPAPTA